MKTRHTLLIACGAILALVIGAAAAHAGWGQLDYLTLRAPLALPGVTLDPGTYVFEIANPTSGANIVRVRNRVTNEPKFLGFTIRVDRPSHTTSVSTLALGEASLGDARPILAWYPTNASAGRAFIYEK
jgi:hypothetical protein